MKKRYVNFPLFMFLLSRVAFIVALALPDFVEACAVCVTGANDASADAFRWSVVFLMAAPYLVFGTIAGCLFFGYRRSAKKRNLRESGDLHLQAAWNQKESGR